MSDDLISRKALLDEFDRVCVKRVMAHGASVNLEIDFVRAVQQASAVDPHEHGRWIPSESYFDDDDTLLDVDDWCDWQCSLCHKDISYEDPIERRWLPEFCSHCGAKMDGGETP